MCHCVYQAYADLLKSHGKEIYPGELSMYNWIRVFTNHSPDDPTLGGTVPYLMRMLMAPRGYKPIVKTLPEFGKNMYLNLYEEKSGLIRMLTSTSDFDESGLHMGPAIYLMLAKQHAAFLEERPESGKPIMSITMEEYNYDKENQYYVPS